MMPIEQNFRNIHEMFSRHDPSCLLSRASIVDASIVYASIGRTGEFSGVTGLGSRSQLDSSFTLGIILRLPAFRPRDLWISDDTVTTKYRNSHIIAVNDDHKCMKKSRFVRTCSCANQYIVEIVVVQMQLVIVARKTIKLVANDN